MKKDKKITKSNFFPDYSYFERAINYPYPTPDYAYSFFKGKFIQGIHLDLEKRIPILSVGSNRAPMQLERKFSINQDLCVTPAILYNSDIVYAASISAYGSIPATQWPTLPYILRCPVPWHQRASIPVARAPPSQPARGRIPQIRHHVLRPCRSWCRSLHHRA